MVETIKIKNFRCFKELSIGGLRRFSVVVGHSGSGKTALLESLFIAAGGGAQVYFKLRTWRGLGNIVSLTGSRVSFEALFREIFFGFDQDTPASIEFLDSRLGRRTLTIQYQKKADYSVSSKGGRIDTAFAIDPIVFRWKIGAKQVSESIVQIDEGALKFKGQADVYPVWLVSPYAPDDSVQGFSDLNKNGSAGPILTAFKSLFPLAHDLSVEISSGQANIYCSIEPFRQKLPIGMLSSGMNKFLTIIVTIASNPGGVVLIDEVESGFYYEHMASMLRSVLDLAETQNVQIIATTHSYEMLKAIAEVTEGEREESFSLLRAERATTGEASVTITRGHGARSLIEQGFEIR
jgi:ABC-type transport system involved in cytochrome c biogenesis ATPase subunit